MIMPIMLWTDLLLFIILGFVFWGGVRISRDPVLCDTWSKVFHRPSAVMSFIVLSFFLLIAVTDSIHFRRPLASTPGSELNGQQGEVHFSSEVESGLDLVLADMLSISEKTYSRPMARQSFSREAVIDSRGEVKHVYPPLLKTSWLMVGEADQVGPRIWKCLAIIVFLVGAVIFLTALVFARRTKLSLMKAFLQLVKGQTEYPLRSAIFSVGCLLALMILCLEFSAYYHVFGTDQVGKDVLYLTIKSVRTGVVIGLVTTLVLLPLAVFLGVSAGFFGGLIDDAIQYLYITINSIPGVLLIVAAAISLEIWSANLGGTLQTSLERGDIKLLLLCVVLGMTSWTSLCRLLRAETLKARELDYVLAARSLGVSQFRILYRHVLPNVVHLILMATVIDFSGLVLAEAVLSYIGVGLDPTTISWGNMINSARLELARVPVVWWPLSAAFTLMLALVLSANVFADCVRDALDPRTREAL